jgi:KDO2-lipid IV(A) lauroyltransferase
VREPEADPKAQEFVRTLLEGKGGDLYTTHFATADPRLGLELLDALRDGDIVALQGDRPRRGGAVVEAELFGRPFPIPVGPFALARLAGVPVVPVFMFREGRRRYRVTFRDPIRLEAGGRREAAIASAARTFAADLEWAIREKPHQWFCFGELWPGR